VLPVQVWLGYQQSLRPVQGSLSLNVDLAATAFLEVQLLPTKKFLISACDMTLALLRT
jgi:eukaryotic translation initiation factor 2C